MMTFNAQSPEGGQFVFQRCESRSEVHLQKHNEPEYTAEVPLGEREPVQVVVML